jgi:predicted RNA-binding protein YlxR (DUF448 family)
VLLRLALDGDRVIADAKQALPGRGAYVCDAACYERALAERAFPRTFRRPVRPGGDTLESLDN